MGSKIHLNNSVQDSTYLHEKVSRDLFLAAGVAVPRSAHALVQLNGRRPRLCVLVEGANKQFLKRSFGSAKGNLYDGGFCRDVNSRMRLNSGEDPRNQSGRLALVRAASEPDLEQRAIALEKVLDIDHFLTFLAMEIMIAHWDGYALNVNNYRLYQNPSSDKMVFIPHGTDQVFQNTGMSPRPQMRGMVAQAVMEIPRCADATWTVCDRSSRMYSCRANHQ
jgi:spore coat protein CotH